MPARNPGNSLSGETTQLLCPGATTTNNQGNIESKSIVLAPKPDINFVGRESLLESIHQHFQSGITNTESSPRVVVLTGKAGIGKSEIARAFASKYESVYKSTVWLDAGSRSSLSNSLKEVIQRVQDSGAIIFSELSAVYKFFSQGLQGGLFIFDNAEALFSADGRFGIFDFLPKKVSSSNLFFLVTTRNGADFSKGHGEESDELKILKVPYLNDEEATWLLLSKLGLEQQRRDSVEDLNGKLKELVRTLRGYPVLFNLLNLGSGRSGNDPLEELQNVHSDLKYFDGNQEDNSEDSEYSLLKFLFAARFASLRKDEIGKVALELLSIMSLMTPDSIYEEDILKIYTNYSGEPLEKGEEALRILQELSVITIEPQTYFNSSRIVIQSLIIELTRKRLQALGSHKALEAIVMFVQVEKSIVTRVEVNECIEVGLAKGNNATTFGLCVLLCILKCLDTFSVEVDRRKMKRLLTTEYVGQDCQRMRQLCVWLLKIKKRRCSLKIALRVGFPSGSDLHSILRKLETASWDLQSEVSLVYFYLLHGISDSGFKGNDRKTLCRSVFLWFLDDIKERHFKDYEMPLVLNCICKGLSRIQVPELQLEQWLVIIGFIQSIRSVPPVMYKKLWVLRELLEPSRYDLATRYIHPQFNIARVQLFLQLYKHLDVDSSCFRMHCPYEVDEELTRTMLESTPDLKVFKTILSKIINGAALAKDATSHIVILPVLKMLYFMLAFDYDMKLFNPELTLWLDKCWVHQFQVYNFELLILDKFMNTQRGLDESAVAFKCAQRILSNMRK